MRFGQFLARAVESAEVDGEKTCESRTGRVQ